MHKEHLDELWLLVTQGGGERAQERFTMGGWWAIYIYISCLQRGLFTDRGLWYLSHKGGQAIFTRMLNSWRPLTFLFLSEVPLQDLFTNRRVECPNLAFVTLRLCTIPSGGRWGSTTPPPRHGSAIRCCHRGYRCVVWFHSLVLVRTLKVKNCYIVN